MSDDPASIKAWQQQMRDDIVARLRAVFHNDRSVELMNREAADEIERLRKALLVEENAYDLMRIANEELRNKLVCVTNLLNLERDINLSKENNLLTEKCRQLEMERDEARRSYCYATGNGEEQRAINVAQSKGWDCFKENTND